MKVFLCSSGETEAYHETLQSGQLVNRLRFRQDTFKVQAQMKQFHSGGMRKLLDRCAKSIEIPGNYVEKQDMSKYRVIIL